MRKNYFFLAAASAMMLASCSNEADGPKKPGDNNSEDVLNLTTLSATSQANRIKKVEGTRDGEKKLRLQLQYIVEPVKDGKRDKWSATSVVFGNGGAYVTWHSDAQAADPATVWGGALDVIAHVDGSTPTFSNTYVNYDSKFNMAISDNDAFYIALTDNKMGAAVARVPRDKNVGIVRQLTGSSANALCLDGDVLYAASGYKNGGVSSISKNFPSKEEGKANVDTIAKINGCKFIVGNLVLGTTDEYAYIYNIVSGEVHNIGAPLLSANKYAEEWDKDGNWTIEAGNQARYYGKHTMAVDGDYIYVAGGQAEKGSQNGLRVINKNTMEQVWGNASNTNAVCVAGDYVYAATADGLRVYKKFDGQKLELFAFESVPAVDEAGNPVLNKEGNQQYVAGTTAHSCNYVAVNGDYVYMANGQSGVYVFYLDKSAPAQEETPAE